MPGRILTTGNIRANEGAPGSHGAHILVEEIRLFPLTINVRNSFSNWCKRKWKSKRTLAKQGNLKPL